MSFALPEMDPNTNGSVGYQAPIGRYLDAMYSSAQHDSVLGSLTRIAELSDAKNDSDSPQLTPEDATARFGVPGENGLKFDQPVTESAARIMQTRKLEERERDFYLANGASALRFLPGMAAAMIGGASNPIDFGLLFVPVVGEEALAARATSTVGRILARRLITRETIQAIAPRAPRLTEAVINGMATQSLYEVAPLIAAAHDKADYNLSDSLFNIGTGGALSAIFHGAGHLFSATGRATQEAMAKTALNQSLRDEPIRVSDFLSLDENAIRESLKFDATQARAEAMQNVGSDMTAVESLARASLEVNGKVGDINEANLVKVAQDVLPIWEQQGKDVSVASRLLERVLGGDRDLDTLQNLARSLNMDFAPLEKKVPAVYHFGEAPPDYKSQFARFELAPATNEEKRGQAGRFKQQRDEALQNAVDAEYKRQVDDFVARKRAENEYKAKNGFTPEEIERFETRSAEGHTVTPETIQQRSIPDKPGAETESLLDSDIESLTRDLGGAAGKPEAREKELAAGNESAKLASDAVRAAVDCLARKVI